MTRTEVAKRISNLYDIRSLRSYVYWKVRTDPAYDAVRDRLRGHENRSLIDIGCGVGLLAFYLREHGFDAPILGIDFDEKAYHLFGGDGRKIGRHTGVGEGRAAMAAFGAPWGLAQRRIRRSTSEAGFGVAFPLPGTSSAPGERPGPFRRTLRGGGR